MKIPEVNDRPAPNDAPAVHPCPTRNYYEDPDWDYIEIVCTGVVHNFHWMKNGQLVKSGWGHETCHRWMAHNEAFQRNKRSKTP